MATGVTVTVRGCSGGCSPAPRPSPLSTEAVATTGDHASHTAAALIRAAAAEQLCAAVRSSFSPDAARGAGVDTTFLARAARARALRSAWTGLRADPTTYVSRLPGDIVSFVVAPYICAPPRRLPAFARSPRHLDRSRDEDGSALDDRLTPTVFVPSSYAALLTFLSEGQALCLDVLDSGAIMWKVPVAALPSRDRAMHHKNRVSLTLGHTYRYVPWSGLRELDSDASTPSTRSAMMLSLPTQRRSLINLPQLRVVGPEDVVVKALAPELFLSPRFWTAPQRAAQWSMFSHCVDSRGVTHLLVWHHETSAAALLAVDSLGERQAAAATCSLQWISCVGAAGCVGPVDIYNYACSTFTVNVDLGIAIVFLKRPSGLTVLGLDQATGATVYEVAPEFCQLEPSVISIRPHEAMTDSKGNAVFVVQICISESAIQVPVRSFFVVIIAADGSWVRQLFVNTEGHGKLVDHIQLTMEGGVVAWFSDGNK